MATHETTNKVKNYYTNTGGGAVYGIGLIGALVYYLQQGGTFWTIVLGIIKAVFWPGFLVYNLLDYLKM